MTDWPIFYVQAYKTFHQLPFAQHCFNARCTQFVMKAAIPARIAYWSKYHDKFVGMNLSFLSVAQSQPSPHRTHCPAPASISNGYYLTDRQSETPLALPAVSLGGEQVKMLQFG